MSKGKKFLADLIASVSNVISWFRSLLKAVKSLHKLCPFLWSVTPESFAYGRNHQGRVRCTGALSAALVLFSQQAVNDFYLCKDRITPTTWQHLLSSPTLGYSAD